MKHLLPLLLISSLAVAAPQIVMTQFPTKDIPVVDRVFTISDQAGDAAPALQAAIDELAASGGGTLFLPAGHIRLKSPIIIKEGVTLRGDNSLVFRQNTSLGTVLDLYHGRNAPDGAPAIGMERGTGLRELVFWYPEQQASQPVPYSWTVAMTAKNCGNNTTFLNCVFTNPWRGIRIGPEWNELHTLRNVKIFPFETGMHIDMCTDIGRLDSVMIASPTFAQQFFPSLPNLDNPRTDGIPSVGIDMARSDWEYMRDLQIIGLKVGFRVHKNDKGGTTNAVMAYSAIQCGTPLELQHLNAVGLSLYKCTFAGKQQAILAADSFSTVTQFNRCRFYGDSLAKAAGSGTLTFDQCKFNTSSFQADAGRCHFLNCDVAANPPAFSMTLGERVARCHILGGNLTKAVKIDNRARKVDLVNCEIPPELVQSPQPDVPNINPRSFQHFQSRNLILATEHGVSPELDDNGPALQKALDTAGKLHSAIVYVPAGFYRFKSNITVPTGVELRGSFCVPHHTVSGGSVLMPCLGEGDENGTPFVSLQRSSGLNGLCFWYPEQSSVSPRPYPWTVQSLGPQCWIVDTNIGNAWQAVDFMTHPSDGHYINYLSGGMLRRGLQVGNSSRGQVIDVQFNPHYEARLPGNLPRGKNNHPAFIEFQREHLDGIVVHNALNETMVGNFLYAAHDGLRFSGHCTATVLMHGTDTAWNPAALECDNPQSRLNFALAQLVPLGKQAVAGIVTRRNFAGTAYFANSQFWAGPATALLDGPGTVVLDQLNTVTGPIVVNHGTLHLAATHFTQGLPVHLAVAKDAKATSLNALSASSAFYTDIAEGASFKAFANATSPQPDIAKDSIAPNWSADFESPSTPPVVENTVATTGGGIRKISDYSCRIAERDDAHSGRHALLVQGHSDDTAYSYIYFEIFKGPFTVMPDTVFTYWIKPLNEKGQNTGIDIHFTNGKVLRDMGIRNTAGNLHHTSVPKGPLGQWTKVEFALGRTAANGLTIEKIMAAYDSRNGGEQFQVLFDDVSMTSKLPASAWSLAAAPDSGTYPQGTTAAIDNQTAFTVRYTLDGTNPVPSSPAYRQPIALPAGVTELRYALFDAKNVAAPFVFARYYTVK